MQTRIERALYESQSREQVGFRKGYSTSDHLQALYQIIEKSNEYNLPLCLGFVDYKKAFDTVEHFAIFEALRKKTNRDKTYVKSLQNIYSQATAGIHVDKLVSDEFPINKGVRQGDPLLPKLFAAVMEVIFKKADISEGTNVDGEKLTNLSFAYDLLFSTKNNKTNGQIFKQSGLKKSESWLKNTQGIDKIHETPCRQ